MVDMFLIKNILGLRNGASTYTSADDDVTSPTSKRLAVFDTTQNVTGTTSQCKGKMTQHVTDTTSQLLRSFAKRGKGKGQLCRPGGVAVTSEGDIVVVDTENCRLHVFNSMGQHLLTIAEKGQGEHQLNQPMDVCIFSHENDECFLVSDSVNACIKIFSRSGSCIQKFGAEPSLFEYPYGVCTSRDRHIVVTDICRHDVTVLASSGTKLAQFGKYGDGPRDFDHPYYVTTDVDQNIIVSDSGNMSIKIFTMEGALLYHFTASDFHIYQEDFVMLQGLATDSAGNVLVAANATVYVLANNGRFWEALLPCGELNTPKGLAYSPLGHLIVVQECPDLENLIYIFRYQIENFRSLKAVPRPKPLAPAARTSEVKTTGAGAAEAKPLARDDSSRRTEKCPRSRPAAAKSKRHDAGGDRPRDKPTAKRTGRGLVRVAVPTKLAVVAGPNYDQPYFLGPKPGTVIRRRTDGESAGYGRRPPAVEYDLDRELEIDLDIIHRLRENSCLQANASKDYSPAHIFGFS